MIHRFLLSISFTFTFLFHIFFYRGILQAAKRVNLTEPFHWIASDGWGKQQKLVEGLEDVAEGAITVELQSEPIPDFDEYMMSLTPENNQRSLSLSHSLSLLFQHKRIYFFLIGFFFLVFFFALLHRNPWFEEYWEDIFSCKMPNNFPLIFKNGSNTKVCEKEFRLSEKVG